MRGRRVDGPDAGIVVGAAGAEVADVGGEEDAGDVVGVGLKGGDGDKGGDVAVLEHAPDVDVALVDMVSGVLLDMSLRSLWDNGGSFPSCNREGCDG